MEFTKEAWENAPEGARLEYLYGEYWRGVFFVGYTHKGFPAIETENGYISSTSPHNLRIILPKRKVKVQLWQTTLGRLASCISGTTIPEGWTLLGEHTFEIEGE